VPMVQIWLFSGTSGWLHQQVSYWKGQSSQEDTQIFSVVIRFPFESTGDLEDVESPV